MSLVVCAACSRHVRRTETTCPFCDASITSAVANAPERALPATRLGRAALFAFAAASVGSAACGGDTSNSGKQNQTVGDAAAGGHASTGTGGDVSVALYGAPFGGSVGAGGTLATGGETGTGGGLVAAYGAPFPPPRTVDAGPDAEAGGAGGADGAGGGSFHTLYGLPHQ